MSKSPLRAVTCSLYCSPSKPPNLHLSTPPSMPLRTCLLMTSSNLKNALTSSTMIREEASLHKNWLTQLRRWASRLRLVRFCKLSMPIQIARSWSSPLFLKFLVSARITTARSHWNSCSMSLTRRVRELSELRNSQLYVKVWVRDSHPQKSNRWLTTQIRTGTAW